MRHCLGAPPNIESDVVKDTIVQRVMPGSPKSLKGHNSITTCWNEASEVSIGIYAKSRCQRSGCLIKKKLGPGRYGYLNPQGP